MLVNSVRKLLGSRLPFPRCAAHATPAASVASSRRCAHHRPVPRSRPPSGRSIACMFQLRGLAPPTGRTSSSILIARIASPSASRSRWGGVPPSPVGQVASKRIARNPVRPAGDSALGSTRDGPKAFTANRRVLRARRTLTANPGQIEVQRHAGQGEIRQVARGEQVPIDVVGVEQYRHREVGLIAPASAQREAARRRAVKRRRRSAPVEAAQKDRPVRFESCDRWKVKPVATDTKGRPWKQPLWQVVQHMVNHGTHHRGQVSGFLRVWVTRRPSQICIATIAV